MTNTMDIINALLPLLSLLLLLIGLFSSHKNLSVIALWTSLIALILHYQTAGGEILGSYFNYLHASIYTLNIAVLLACTIYVLLGITKNSNKTIVRFLSSFIIASTIISTLLLVVNLWINASFIENKMEGTPILQVATFKKLDYCNFSYVFYKVGSDGKISYMCPNYYGLLPSVGVLQTAPEYLIRQLPHKLQEKFLSSH